MKKALNACPEDIARACMRCSLCIHELKAFPGVAVGVDIVRILEYVYVRLGQLQRKR